MHDLGSLWPGDGPHAWPDLVPLAFVLYLCQTYLSCISTRLSSWRPPPLGGLSPGRRPHVSIRGHISVPMQPLSPRRRPHDRLSQVDLLTAPYQAPLPVPLRLNRRRLLTLYLPSPPLGGSCVLLGVTRGSHLVSTTGRFPAIKGHSSHGPANLDFVLGSLLAWHVR